LWSFNILTSDLEIYNFMHFFHDNCCTISFQHYCCHD
jgi:hypothetical protein